MNLKKLGLRIKSQREKQKLRQIDIANALQISYQAVSKWERGENAPDIALVLQLAKILNVSVEWLLADKESLLDTFDATVFCTSLNGFAEKSKNLPPAELATWINQLFYALTEIILKYNGVPVKYVGDGFLAFFTGEASQRAIEIATRTKKIIDNKDLIIALHHGPIYLGTIGHPDYSSKDILGDTVNTSFLIMPWIAEHCSTGIGFTEKVSKSNELGKKRGITDLVDGSKLTIWEPDKRLLE